MNVLVLEAFFCLCEKWHEGIAEESHSLNIFADNKGWVNLTKEVKDLHTEKYQTLAMGVEENTDKWKDIVR